MKLKISEEIKHFITPLSDEEKSTLRLSLLNNGCRDPLIAWRKSDDIQVLIDGHNRYDICIENNIPFEIKELSFDNIEGVKDWMIDNQLGRRNLNPDQMSYYRGLKYDRLKQKRGGYNRIESKGQNVPLTAEVLAKEFNVSPKTVKRDAQFSKGLDRIGHANPKLRHDILGGKFKMNKNDLQFIGSQETFPQRKFRNVADLENEIGRIKKQVQPQQPQKNIEENILAQIDTVTKKEELFKSKKERIDRKKAQIVSAVNQFIRQEDKESFKNLKMVIDELGGLVLGR